MWGPQAGGELLEEHAPSGCEEPWHGAGSRAAPRQACQPLLDVDSRR